VGQAVGAEEGAAVELQLSMLKFDGKWWGIPFGRGHHWERLDYRGFVYPNFGTEDGGEFLRHCRANPGKRHRIPTGDATGDGPGSGAAELVLPHIEGTQPGGFAPNGFVPVVQYQQGNASTCVFSSAASAICAFGDERAATNLGAFTNESLKHPNRMDYLNRIVREELTGWRVTRALTGDAAAAFDCLEDRPPFPTCIQIHGSDGCTTHCISTLGDWIFDSNMTHALPLCQASLDLCTNGATFKGCVKVLRLEPSKKLLRVLGKRRRE